MSDTEDKKSEQPEGCIFCKIPLWVYIAIAGLYLGWNLVLLVIHYAGSSS
jgi:hypothetical protein